jgi:hypothetical protein
MECLRTYYQELIVIALSIVFLYIPFVGKFLRVINTLIHESGHAFFALLCSGSVDSIELNPDASGLARTKSKNVIATVIITLSGYLFASAFAFLSFWMLKEKDYQWFFYCVLSIGLMNLLLWVRSAFGIFWIIFFIGITGLVWWYFPGRISFLYALGVATMIQFESLFSTIVLMKISIKKPNAAGDAAQLQKTLWLPAIIWALLFFVFALYCSYQILLLSPCKDLLN